MQKVKVAVVGASGYSGEELVRLLSCHPAVEVACVTSRQYAGKTVGEVFPKFRGGSALSRLAFVEPRPEAIALTGATVAFLALPHGAASDYAVALLAEGLKVIDLSADFRLKDAAVYEEFYGEKHPAPQLLAESVYGAPERRADAIRSARLVASPGCYPTSVLLPLCPLLERKLISTEGIVICSASGVSGAGRKSDIPLLFCECNESVRAYGVPKHRHLSEIEQELALAAGGPVTVSFAPHLVPITRGIHTSIYVRPLSLAALECIDAAYEKAYGKAPFVRVLGGAGPLPDTKHVAWTNYADIAWRFDVRTGALLLLCAIDNLTKGAAGQAVQSMNLMCGLPEALGLGPEGANP